jgi:hypothetical protein
MPRSYFALGLSWSCQKCFRKNFTARCTIIGTCCWCCDEKPHILFNAVSLRTEHKIIMYYLYGISSLNINRLVFGRQTHFFLRNAETSSYTIPSLQANSFPLSQEIVHILQISMLITLFHKGPHFFPILGQMPIGCIPSYFYPPIYAKVFQVASFLQVTPKYPSSSLASPPCVPQDPPISSSLIIFLTK